MKTRKKQTRALRSLTVALSSVSLAAVATGADSCIVSGSTVASPASVHASAGIAVSTDRVTTPTLAVALDARDRTRLESEPIGIDPSLTNGLLIYIH